MNKNDDPCQTFPILGTMKIEVELIDIEKFPNADYAIYINTLSGIRITSYFPIWMNKSFEDKMPKTFILNIQNIKLNSGEYRIGLVAAYANAGDFIDLVENAASFSVESVDIFGSGRHYPAYCGIIIPEGEFQSR